MVGSLLGSSSSDPHGYVLVFGTLLLIPVSIIGAMALLFTASRDQYRARRWATWGAIIWIVGAMSLAAFSLSG